MRTATFQNGARATDGDDGTLAKTEASVKNTLRPSGNIFVFVLLCGTNQPILIVIPFHMCIGIFGL